MYLLQGDFVPSEEGTGRFFLEAIAEKKIQIDGNFCDGGIERNFELHFVALGVDILNDAHIILFGHLHNSAP